MSGDNGPIAWWGDSGLDLSRGPECVVRYVIAGAVERSSQS